MIHKISARYRNVFIRQPEIRDLELLRTWRNDKTNSKYISQVGHITEEMQDRWFEQYLKDDNHCMFVIEETFELYRMVGSVALYDFRPDICECGKFMIGDIAAHGKGIGMIGITLAMYAGFEVFNLSAIDAVVHEDNISALTTDQKAGFKIIGEHHSPIVSGKMDKELLSPKQYFYELHDFLGDIEFHAR